MLTSYKRPRSVKWHRDIDSLSTYLISDFEWSKIDRLRVRTHGTCLDGDETGIETQLPQKHDLIIGSRIRESSRLQI